MQHIDCLTTNSHIETVFGLVVAANLKLVAAVSKSAEFQSKKL